MRSFDVEEPDASIALVRNCVGLEGVATPQCHVLLELADLKTASITELQNYLVLDKSVVTRTVDTLVKQGLIDRNENPEDRRYGLLHLNNENVDTSAVESDSYY